MKSYMESAGDFQSRPESIGVAQSRSHQVLIGVIRNCSESSRVGIR